MGERGKKAMLAALAIGGFAYVTHQSLSSGSNPEPSANHPDTDPEFEPKSSGPSEAADAEDVNTIAQEAQEVEITPDAQDTRIIQFYNSIAGIKPPIDSDFGTRNLLFALAGRTDEVRHLLPENMQLVTIDHTILGDSVVAGQVINSPDEDQLKVGTLLIWRGEREEQVNPQLPSSRLNEQLLTLTPSGEGSAIREARIDLDGQEINTLADFAPDGSVIKFLAIDNTEGPLWLYPQKSGVVLNPDGETSFYSVTPVDTLASRSNRELGVYYKGKIIDTYRPTGTDEYFLLDHDDEAFLATYNPDGSLTATHTWTTEPEAWIEIAGGLPVANETPIELLTNPGRDIYSLDHIDGTENLIDAMNGLVVSAETEAGLPARTVEIIVTKDTLKIFMDKGINFQAWLDNHANKLNQLMANESAQYFNIRVGNIYVVSNKAISELGQCGINLNDNKPDTISYRWPFPSDYPYFEPTPDGLDNALLHEWGHYLMLLWDHYMPDVMSGNPNITIQSKDNSGRPITIDDISHFCSSDDLMCGGSGDQILIDLDALVLRYFQENGIGSWAEGSDWWLNKAMDMIGDTQFALPPGFEGNNIHTIRLFKAEATGASDTWNLEVRFNEKPDLEFTVQGNTFTIPGDILTGYSNITTIIGDPNTPGECTGMVFKHSHRFFIEAVDAEGNSHFFSFNSFDLLEAWFKAWYGYTENPTVIFK